MSIAILGGTFDPIHLGHIYIAQYVLEKYRCEKFLFIPNQIPPHSKKPISSEHRVQMMKLALSNYPKFEIDFTEINNQGKSYTIDTVKSLRKKHPLKSLIFIMGDDAFATFNQWKDWDQIIQYVHLAIVKRTYPDLNNELKAYLEAHQPKSKDYLGDTTHGHVYTINNPINRCASTIIRQTLQNHQHLSSTCSQDLLNLQLPDQVAYYLSEHRLYSQQNHQNP